MPDRPLPSDNKVEWRKYAETLEAELDGLRPKETGFTLRGIRVLTDKTLPDGEAHIRYHGITVGKITNVPRDFEEQCRHGNMTKLTPTFDLLTRAIHLVRKEIRREPDEIRIRPTPQFEPCKPGQFPRIVGETTEQYITRYSLYSASQRKMMRSQMDDGEEWSHDR